MSLEIRCWIVLSLHIRRVPRYFLRTGTNPSLQNIDLVRLNEKGIKVAAVHVTLAC
jgi:hypothetical protein